MRETHNPKVADLIRDLAKYSPTREAYFSLAVFCVLASGCEEQTRLCVILWVVFYLVKFGDRNYSFLTNFLSCIKYIIELSIIFFYTFDRFCEVLRA